MQHLKVKEQKCHHDPKRPCQPHCTWTKSSLKGDITLGKKGKERGESFTGAFCCSNKDTLLPRLQQSWCSRGRYNAAHAGRKQQFKFPQGRSHLCHTERLQVSSVVRRKQKQVLLKIPTIPLLVRWPSSCIIIKQTKTLPLPRDLSLR